MFIHFHPEVDEARRKGRPIVALESTVLSHGLPYPENVGAAAAMTDAIRAAGAVPAVVAVVAGRVKVGLTPAEIEHLAGSPDIRKCSPRDLPVISAQRRDGATTVAATVLIAHAAGIPVFATGGIGGVHRGQPMDVSADLPALARYPLTVVCAGAKAILDLPLTLERLETDGVCVAGYGCDTFPAFFCRSSGLPVDVRCDTPDDVVTLMEARDTLGMSQSILVTVPVPVAAALREEEAEPAVAAALISAKEQGLAGKAITPYLLGEISRLTGHRSRMANLALLKNNARVAARIAVAYQAGKKRNS